MAQLVGCKVDQPQAIGHPSSSSKQLRISGQLPTMPGCGYSTAVPAQRGADQAQALGERVEGI